MQRIMDSAHCYLVHSIRIPPSEIEKKQQQLTTCRDRGDNEDDELRDYWTEAICGLMANRRKLSRFRKCNRFENAHSKFMTYDVMAEQEMTINAMAKQNGEKQSFVSSINTILDEFTTEMQKSKNTGDVQTLSMFQRFVERENFDTETVHDDLGVFEDSNIMNQLSASRSFHSIGTKLMAKKVGSSAAGTYSSGYRFFYWPFYRNNTAEGRPVFHVIGNVHHMEMNLGYNLGDWYIEKKYADFKEEALKNKSVKITLIQWLMTLSQAKIKLEQWRRSDEARVCGWICLGNYWAQAYGLKDGSPVTVQHVMALLFYCDFTTTSKEFSQTFRKIWAFESDDALKHRHSEVAIWARLLRELIEGFGFTMEDPDREMMNRQAFYHGISGSLTLLPNQICGPLSTSSGTLCYVNVSDQLPLRVRKI